MLGATLVIKKFQIKMNEESRTASPKKIIIKKSNFINLN